MSSVKKIDLVDILKEPKGLIAIIDNDTWHIVHDNDEQDTIVSSNDDIVKRGDGGYGSGNLYGGDILQALAAIIGLKVESV